MHHVGIANMKLSAEQIARIAWSARAEYLGSLETVVVPEDWRKLDESYRDKFTARVEGYLKHHSDGGASEYYHSVTGNGIKCRGGWESESEQERDSYRIASSIARGLSIWFDPSL